jgi:hypothetical protein
MIRLTALAMVAVLAGAVASTPAVSPSYAEAPAKLTADERAAARAATKAKRVECGRQADERNLHLVKRYRFVRSCMKSA